MFTSCLSGLTGNRRAGTTPLEGPVWYEVDSKERVHVPVRLNVYDVGDSEMVGMINCVARPFGGGIFHVGIEVFGIEYAFAADEDEGIYLVAPRQDVANTFRESVEMGDVFISLAEVEDIIDSLRPEWHPSSYDLLAKNCCHFVGAVLRKLDLGDLPPWLLSLPNVVARVETRVDEAVSAWHQIWRRASTAAMDEVWGWCQAEGGKSRSEQELLVHDKHEKYEHVRDETSDKPAGTSSSTACDEAPSSLVQSVPFVPEGDESPL